LELDKDSDVRFTPEGSGPKWTGYPLPIKRTASTVTIIVSDTYSHTHDQRARESKRESVGVLVALGRQRLRAQLLAVNRATTLRL